MGRTPNTERYAEIEKVSSRHRHLMRLQLMGYTPMQMSKEVGMTAQQVSTVINSPLYLEELKRLQKEADSMTLEKETGGSVRKFLLEESVNSLNTIRNLRDGSTEDGVRLRSATEILDRAGYTQKKETDRGTIVQINIGEAQVKDLERADDLFKQSNK